MVNDSSAGERADPNATPPAGEQRLQDKVVLILQGAASSVRSLATSLARHGADIVLVYFDQRHQQAAETKRLVESSGRTCLTIPAEADSQSLPEQVMARILQQFGRLDIFIDFTTSRRSRPEATALDERVSAPAPSTGNGNGSSATKNKNGWVGARVYTAPNGNGQEERQDQEQAVFPNLRMMVAALNQMVD